MAVEEDLNFLNAEDEETEEERSGNDDEVPVCCERFCDNVCFLLKPGDNSGLLLLRLLFFRLESLTKAGSILTNNLFFPVVLY